jgi:hypothetical protein
MIYSSCIIARRRSLEKDEEIDGAVYSTVTPVISA